MEGNAKTRGMRAGGAQQFCRHSGFRAEFAGKIIGRAALGQGQPHHKPARAFPGFGQDFPKLISGVEHEIAHAEIMPGGTDRGTGFHRVHEMQFCLREHAAQQANLGIGSAVKMRDAAGRDGAQDRGLRIAFHGIKDVTRKGCLKIARRFGDSRRTQAIDRVFRLQDLHQTIHGRARRHAGGTAQRGNGSAGTDMAHHRDPF